MGLPPRTARGAPRCIVGRATPRALAPRAPAAAAHCGTPPAPAGPSWRERRTGRDVTRLVAPKTAAGKKRRATVADGGAFRGRTEFVPSPRAGAALLTRPQPLRRSFGGERQRTGTTFSAAPRVRDGEGAAGDEPPQSSREPWAAPRRGVRSLRALRARGKPRSPF